MNQPGSLYISKLLKRKMKEHIKKTLFTIKENKNTQITHLDSKREGITHLDSKNLRIYLLI